METRKIKNCTMALNGTAEDFVTQLRKKFGWEEYLVFAIVLSLSAAIGVFYGFFSKKSQNNEEFLMGGRSMTAGPVALSIMCSFISALTVLGNPMETYSYGTQYMTIVLCVFPLGLILNYVYAPVYFKLQLTSAYEYFELRFNSTVRVLLSLIHAFYMVVYMALAVYGPSLALSQVTGFDTMYSVISIFAVCIFYSTLGGFRAVIWTDALQGLIMILSLAVIAIKGTIDVGGVKSTWNRLEETGRVSFFRFDPDPRARHSVWAVLVGGLFMYLNNMAGLQGNIQRYSTMPNMKTVKRSVYLCCIFIFITIFLCSYTGVVVFARYHNCDPINAKLVKTTDQILPLFVMDIIGDTPGLPGLFVAGITCASLSSVSSALNALSAIVVEDYLVKLKPDVSEGFRFQAARVVSVVCGIASFSFVFAVRLMGDIFPAAVSMIGAMVAPTFGMFSLGMMFPFANSLGSLIGVVVAYGFSIFLGLGAVISGGNGDLPNQKCSVSTTGCQDFFTDIQSVTYIDHSIDPLRTWKHDESSSYIQLMSISYLYGPLIGTLATIVFGLVFSGLVHWLGWSKDEPQVNKDCLSPPFLRMWELFSPELVNKFVSEKGFDRDIKETVCFHGNNRRESEMINSQVKAS